MPFAAGVKFNQDDFPRYFNPGDLKLGVDDFCVAKDPDLGKLMANKDFRIALHSEENQTQSLLTDFPKKPHHASNLVKIGDGLMARKQNFNGNKPSIAIVSYKTTKNRISESFASVQRKTAKVIRKQQLKQIRMKLYSDDDEES